MVSALDMELEQLDVKIAFLRGNLEEQIYMSQPDGFLEEFNNCVYSRKLSDGSSIYLLLYMDDMLIAAKSKIDIDALKAMLSSEFEMKDLGVSKKILGMEIWRDRNASLLCVSQKKYIENLLQSFQMENSKPDRLERTKRVTRRDTPSVYEVLVADINALESRIIKLNGNIASIKRKHNPDRKSLPKTSTLRCSKCEGYGHETHQCPNRDASPMTHEDLNNYISYLREEEVKTMQKLDVLKRRFGSCENVVNRFMGNLGKACWEVVKWIMRFLKDYDYGGDLVKRRSLTCYIFALYGCAISWKATLQLIIDLSSTEAEYMSLTEWVK
ncbi:uncharacterized protein LOC114169449 [Vigna unguiculata]|uniref:uncharacterized protein LOC114169449 n=1 Tax=Vigna unguiculata TaxID=3917 RepID=UPI001016DEAA|nr:uncharacterized protein LOC114169449 [Vigna unguiculata]